MSNPALRSGRTANPPGARSDRKLAPEKTAPLGGRRAPWRQQLVEAERGLSYSFRADSALYLHLFLDSLLLVTCGVLGLPATHWAIVVVCLTLMLFAELASQALQTAVVELSQGARQQIRALCTAAKLLAMIGCTSAILIVLIVRGRELFGS